MFVIGIGGGTGSGKSTIIRMLQQRLGDEAFAVLPHDMYYFNTEDVPMPLRKAGNFDHPLALDNKLYLRHVRNLRRGHAIEHPVYRAELRRRDGKTVRVEPRPVLVLDGILIYAIPMLLPLIDLKVFVDTPDDLRAVRRIQRNVGREHGFTLEAVIEQYLSTVRPMHEQFVAPAKRIADLIIPWEEYSETAVDVLASRIRQENQRMTSRRRTGRTS